MGGLAAAEVVLVVLAGLVLLVGLLSAASLVDRARKRLPDSPWGYRPYPRLRKPPGSRS